MFLTWGPWFLWGCMLVGLRCGERMVVPMQGREQCVTLCHGLVQLVCYREGFARGIHQSPKETRMKWDTASAPHESGRESTSLRGHGGTWV